MKVKQLIKKLEKFDKDFEVIISSESQVYNTHGIDIFVSDSTKRVEIHVGGYIER